MEVAVVFALLFTMMFLGAPIGFSLLVAGGVGLYLKGGMDTLSSMFGSTTYTTLTTFLLSTIPMFVLLGEFIARSAIGEDLFTFVYRWVSRVRGSLAVTGIVASAIFGAMSGSGAAAAVTMGRVAVPQMQRFGYKDELAAGSIALGATLDPLIPPSLMFIFYGLITESSIGQLYAAGVIPGLLSMAMLCVAISVWTRLQPDVAPASPQRFSWREKLENWAGLIPSMILIGLVLGSIYIGVATPTEAAAMGAFGAMIIPLVTRRIGLRETVQVIQNTARVSSMIFVLVVGAMIFSYFVTITQVPQALVQSIVNSGMPVAAILATLVVMYLLLGCILDAGSIVLITLPLLSPLLKELHVDMIWWGVIMVKLIGMGLVHPPLGMNCFIINGVTGIPLIKVFKGSMILLLFDFITLGLLLSFPALSTWLPSLVVEAR